MGMLLPPPFSLPLPPNMLILIETVLLRYLPYILESNPHPFYSFRGLKKSDMDYNRVRIRFAVESWILEK